MFLRSNLLRSAPARFTPWNRSSDVWDVCSIELITSRRVNGKSDANRFPAAISVSRCSTKLSMP